MEDAKIHGLLVNNMLLSRVAESLYWINRYLERAENISRFVEVSEAM